MAAIPVIYFGISNISNIEKNIRNWINITSQPVLFCEREEHLSKYPDGLLGKYEVVSLSEALTRYPGAHFWVTTGLPASAIKYLSGNTSPERIHMLNLDLTYGQSCRFIQQSFIYRNDSFGHYCMNSEVFFTHNGSLKEKLAEWERAVIKMTDSYKLNPPKRCLACANRKYDVWNSKPSCNLFVLGQNMKYDACNLKCTYCVARNKLARLKEKDTGLSSFDVLNQLYEMPDYREKKLRILLANGEFLANRYCNEMIDIILKANWEVELLSNMTIYREKFAELLDSGKVRLISTSLDSGTRETYKRIKQRDMFDKVIDNFKRYPIHKTDLVLKYILLDGVNDNLTDIAGFLSIAKDLGAAVSISNDNGTPFTEHMKVLIIALIKKAKNEGIKVRAATSFVRPDDVKFINESYNSL